MRIVRLFQRKLFNTCFLRKCPWHEGDVRWECVSIWAVSAKLGENYPLHCPWGLCQLFTSQLLWTEIVCVGCVLESRCQEVAFTVIFTYCRPLMTPWAPNHVKHFFSRHIVLPRRKKLIVSAQPMGWVLLSQVTPGLFLYDEQGNILMRNKHGYKSPSLREETPVSENERNGLAKQRGVYYSSMRQVSLSLSLLYVQLTEQRG